MESVKRVVSKQLGQLLVERGLIDKKQLQKALEIQKKEGGLIGQVLVKLNFVTEEDIVEALTTQYGYPYLPLENYEIDKSVLSVLPAHVVRHYYLIPIDKIENILTVVMADPLNLYAIRDIEQMTKMKIEIFVSTVTDIEKSIEKYYGKVAKPLDGEKEEDKLSKADFATTARESLKEKKGKKEDKKA
jgi:type IV pilus assembly protein PilB